MTFENFDRIFEHIGGFGRYQMLLFVFGCLLNIFVAIVYCGQIFITLTPPHWCSAPPELLHLNLSEQQLKLLTVPLREDGTDFHTCLRYTVNLTQVTWDNISRPDPSWPITSCTDGWTYNYSLYYPTITSQMDWVCEDDWRPTMAQSLFFIGSLFGCPTLGWVADRWGRIPTTVFSNLLAAIIGIASAFSSSFIMFIVSRFLIGFIYEQHYTIGFILMLEYVGPKYRTLVSNLPSVFYIGTNCVLPWLAWAVADWKMYTIVIHVPLLLSLSFIWIIPESARWLLGQGRVEETLNIIKRAAEVNQRSLSPDVIRDIKVFSAQRTDIKKSSGVLDLMRSRVLRKRFILLCVMWSVSNLAYDAHLRNTENTGYNVFLSFTIASVMELPATVMAIICTEWLGRRHTTVWSIVLTGMIGLPVTALSIGMAILL
ncbi:solute carrier family 22 member 3-like [Panulirus ornatus]|uniref:solute carrier family 22 member 3-like n=1 Tax=Panulirus ornatus TaxID=150431 RepID=UPI003A8C2FE0